MAANVLRSPRARVMSIFVIRSFVRMREELAANAVMNRALWGKIVRDNPEVVAQNSALGRKMEAKKLPSARDRRFFCPHLSARHGLGRQAFKC